MELLKGKDHLTFAIGGVTFYIRATPTVRDKLAMDMVGDYVNGQFKVDRTALFLKIIELFVVGWAGVTENGQDVPYSLDTMLHRLPYDGTKDWMLQLGSHIIDALRLFQADDEKKNDSPTPPIS